MDLEALRDKIDALDTVLLRLLNERADYVHEIGEIKKQQGLEIYAPEREEKLLQRLVEKSNGRLTETSIRAIYREVMSAALALEQNLKVAYLGPEGTRSHWAAIHKFGASVTYLAQDDPAAVFAKVESRETDYGVIPIDSRLVPKRTPLERLFRESPLKICAQIPSASGENTNRSQADDESRTRFVVVGRRPCPRTGNDRTALIVTVAGDKAASDLRGLAGDSLVCLHPIADGEEKGDTETQRHFVELAGHPDDAQVAALLDALDDGERHVLFIGSYPRPWA